MDYFDLKDLGKCSDTSKTLKEGIIFLLDKEIYIYRENFYLLRYLPLMPRREVSLVTLIYG